MGDIVQEVSGRSFSGESQAHMKYLIFAMKAREEGFENVARLFEAIAFAEFVHARNHLKGKEASNLPLKPGRFTQQCT